MSKPTHTPGPWHCEPYHPDGQHGFGFYAETDDEDTPIVWQQGGVAEEPNARLMAASPKLLVSLKEMVAAMEQFEMNLDEAASCHHRCLMNRARAIIAEAEPHEEL